MVQRPSISVIIPVYNLEGVVGRCLDSILSQSLKSIEVIVIDDKSTDNTLKIVKKYAVQDNRVCVVALEKNGRQANARNIGLKRAKGKYIHFCDGDDTVTDEAYSILYNAAERQQADIVVGNYARRYYENHDIIVRPYSHYQSKDALERCFESCNVTLWNKLFKRQFIENHGIRFDRQFKYNEDMLFYCYVLKANPKAAYTDEMVYVYTEQLYDTVYTSNTNAIRFADERCIRDTLAVYREIYTPQLKTNISSWKHLLTDHYYWLHHFCWLKISNKEEFHACFDEIQAFFSDLNDLCPHIFHWTDADLSYFFDFVFHMDYITFVSCDFQTFLLLYNIAKKTEQLRSSCENRPSFARRCINKLKRIIKKIIRWK